MSDPWLKEKQNRNRRLAEHLRYIMDFAQEILTANSGQNVIDLGPGPGELLEIARELGFDAYGFDAAPGQCVMGEPYLAASRLMHERQGLNVECGGIDCFMNSIMAPHRRNNAVLINSRGSLEQFLVKIVKSPPERFSGPTGERPLAAWIESGRTHDVFVDFLVRCREELAIGGILLIHVNKMANAEFYHRTIVKAANEAGSLRLAERRGFSLHRWIKVS